MIKVLRTRLQALGPCRGFALEIQFHTDLNDQQFEEFTEALHGKFEAVRLVNLAASITARTVDIDTSDVLRDDPTSFLRDVQGALRDVNCRGHEGIPFAARNVIPPPE